MSLPQQNISTPEDIFVERYLGKQLQHGRVLVFSFDVQKKDKLQTQRTKFLLESNNIEYDEVDLSTMDPEE